MNLPSLSNSTLVLSMVLLPALSAAADTSVAVAAPTISALSRSSYLGKAPTSQKVTILVGLKMANLAAMEASALDLNNPKSRNFRHFLTPTQVGSRFGQSTTDIGKIKTYLGKYFSKITITPDRTALLLDGNVGQANSAFGVTIGKYRGIKDDVRVGSLDFYANPTAPKLPSSFASKITVVAGLESFYRKKPMTTLTPSMHRTLYKVDSLYNGPSDSPVGSNLKGEGVNIGISNFDGFRVSNLSLFYSAFGLPAPAGGVGSNVRIIPVAGGTGSSDQASGEGDLDLQMVTSVAPKANIFVYDAPNTVANGVILQQRELSENVVDVVTESYGTPVLNGTFSIVAQQHAIHVAMANVGITYLVSSGDFGTYGPVVENPTSAGEVNDAGSVIDPYITVVGGTAATTDAAGNRQLEEGWVGSGGGYTTYRLNGLDFNFRPSWQKNVGIANDAAHDYRLYPDVALHASGENLPFDAAYNASSANFAYDIFIDGSATVSSGTSASSPLFAGQLGLMLQKLRANNAVDPNPGSGLFRLGFINPSLYEAADDATAGAFTDITVGSNGNLPDGTLSTAGTGYDTVTGLGAPNLTNLYNYFFSLAGTSLTQDAVSTAIFNGLGTDVTNGNPDGSGVVESLVSTNDGTYTITSAKQGGVGQVAASTIDVTVKNPSRLSATVRVVFGSPELTTDYVYLKNFTKTAAKTGSNPVEQPVYDVVKTVAGNDSMSTVVVPITLDDNGLSPYILNGDTTSGKVQILVRALKPQRFGAAPFTLIVDQAVVLERIPRSG